MTEFTVNGVRYMGVEVPEGATDFSVGNEFLQSRPYKGGTRLNKLPAGNYEIVGAVKDLRYRHPADAVGIESALIHFNLTDNTLILKIKENE